MEFDLSNGSFNVVNEPLLPVPLRNAIIDTSTNNNYSTFVKNYQHLQNFFRNRYLSIKRENAKKILNALHISQSNDDDTLIKVMIMCKALSITDDYWLTNDPDEKWENVNLRTNPLHETISQIALYGNSPLTITGKIHTPELTGQGAYAKAWKRENDMLYLYKAGTKNGNEAKIEASVSKILDFTNVPHIKYKLLKENGKILTKCRNMCNDNYSIVTANDIFSWCNRREINFDEFVLSRDAENFYKTLIVDYLITNSDRHGQNWGFYMDNKSGEIKNMHPLFDHNNAFDENEMKLKDGGESLMMLGKSKREAAQYAIKKCDFKIAENIPLDIFISKEHCESFVNRAKDLKLKISVKKNYLKNIVNRIIR